jgi:hypothetical protein
MIRSAAALAVAASDRSDRTRAAAPTRLTEK